MVGVHFWLGVFGGVGRVDGEGHDLSFTGSIQTLLSELYAREEDLEPVEMEGYEYDDEEGEEDDEEDGDNDEVEKEEEKYDDDMGLASEADADHQSSDISDSDPEEEGEVVVEEEEEEEGAFEGEIFSLTTPSVDVYKGVAAKYELIGYGTMDREYDPEGEEEPSMFFDDPLMTRDTVLADAPLLDQTGVSMLMSQHPHEVKREEDLKSSFLEATRPRRTAEHAHPHLNTMDLLAEPLNSPPHRARRRRRRVRKTPPPDPNTVPPETRNPVPLGLFSENPSVTSLLSSLPLVVSDRAAGGVGESSSGLSSSIVDEPVPSPVAVPVLAPGTSAIGSIAYYTGRGGTEALHASRRSSGIGSWQSSVAGGRMAYVVLQLKEGAYGPGSNAKILLGAIPAAKTGVPKAGKLTTGASYDELASWPELDKRWILHVPSSLPAAEQVILLDSKKLSKYVCVAFASTHDRGGIVKLASISLTVL